MSEDMPYTLIRFKIQEGQREYMVSCVVSSDHANERSDEELVQECIDQDAERDRYEAEEYYWIYYGEALCRVISRKDMTEATKQLFNEYGVA